MQQTGFRIAALVEGLLNIQLIWETEMFTCWASTCRRWHIDRSSDL